FALVFYLFWLVSAQEMRYLLPALPALALAISMSDDLFSAAIDGWKRWAHRIALALAAAGFLINVGAIVYYFNQFNYAKVFFGRVTTEKYLKEKFNYYQFYEYINKSTPANAKIFLINASNQTFYLDRDNFSDSVFEAYTISHIVAESRKPEEIGDR